MKNVIDRSKFHEKNGRFLPLWMARYGSETSFLLIFSARDDLVKVSWKSHARKCQNQLTPPYFDQLSERHHPLWLDFIVKDGRLPLRSKNEGAPLHSGKMTTPESNELFWALEHFENGRNLFTPSSQKLVQKDQPGRQQWSEENTAAYIGFPTLTRWSTQEPMIDTKII